MHIVHNAGSLEAEASGPSYSVPNLARSLAQAGNRVDLVSLGPPGETTNGSFRHLRCAPSFAGLPLASKFDFSFAMKAELARLASAAEVIHTHGLWRMPTIDASNVARRGSVSFVVSPRGMFAPPALAHSVLQKRLFSLFFQSRALKTVAMFHATSPQERDDIRAAGFRQPVAVVANGIDLPEQAKSQLDLKKRTVLFFGRVHPIKQVENLVRAWAKLEATHQDWRLEICGPGDAGYLAQLRGLAQSLGLSRCSFSPAIYGDQKTAAFRAAALYVLPSASENFGMTVAESLAAGTPVIATDGTPWQGLDQNRCGWWVGQGPDPLAAALLEAMALTDDERQAMGQRGRDWMLRDFSWSAVARDMLAAYRWLRHGGENPPFVFV